MSILEMLLYFKKNILKLYSSNILNDYILLNN